MRQPTRSCESIVKFMIAQTGCIDVVDVTVHCHSLLPEQWSEGSRGSNCVIVPNFVAIGQAVAEMWRFFSIFPRCRPSAILDLLCVCLDHPQRAFGGLYHCGKFCWNRCSSFDNMHVFRFHQFGSKMPIYAPKMGRHINETPKRHILGRKDVI